MILFPIVAFAVSYYLFMKARFVVKNYEGKMIPYSIGSVLIVCMFVHVLFFVNVSEQLYESLFYFMMIWLFGLLDDIYGQSFPKGLQGHIYYMYKKRRLTTGIVKAVGTVLVSIQLIVTWELQSYDAFIAFWLLVSFPHVMNLFDTRPLRVWKIAVVVGALLLMFAPIDRHSLGLLVIVLGIWYLVEGRKWAMLGDNGSTFVGALLAVFAIQVCPINVQICFCIVTAYCIWYAECSSISELIEKVNVLKKLDQLGIRKTQ